MKTPSKLEDTNLERTPWAPFIALLAMFAIPTTASAQFEGIIESRNLTTDETGAPQEFIMTMYIKRDMVKIRTTPIGSAAASTIIYRSDKNLVWMLNEDDSTYFEIPRESHSEQIQVPHEAGAVQYKPISTGKTKKILGYSCTQIVFKRPGEETTIWATKGLGNLFQAISDALGVETTETPGEWTNELTKKGMFPLVSSTKLNRKVVESQEVTRIEKKALAPELFDLPSSFRRQAMDEMMQGEQ